MFVTALVDIPVTAEPVRSQHKLEVPVFVLLDVAAGAADHALERPLDAVPMLFAAHDQIAVAVRADTLIRIAEPGPLIHRCLNGFDDVFAHLMCACDLVVFKQYVARAAVPCGQELIDNDRGLCEHRGRHGVQSQPLPVFAGTADRDQTGDLVRIFFDFADLQQEGQFISQETMGEAGIDGTRHQIVCRNTDDQAIVFLHLCDKCIHIILIFQNAAGIVTLAHSHVAHAHRAAFTARAGKNVVVKQID